MEPRPITPGKALYLTVNKSGRHGLLSDWNAVGRSWKEAVSSSCYTRTCTYMNEGGSYEYSSTKVLAEEEHSRRDSELLELFGNDGKSSTLSSLVNVDLNGRGNKPKHENRSTRTASSQLHDFFRGFMCSYINPRRVCRHHKSLGALHSHTPASQSASV